ncbi:SPOR domain-containing protein [Planctobacterium marinum]|uniref:Cell division protein DamX n=1 Tax=Planctobacterium marinum TaxID=1631968 RepID=A0AA48HN04_9ALTE|nr:hypothetical protein MACH26_37350 [Planctobacterium marinum]
MQHSTLLTEYTDISQRLEYLVAHSSQMVFVTGEDVAVQQGFVEAFLGQQSQRANVAFINARRGKNSHYYLQQLCEQLQIRLTRGHSLVQAFAARADKSEPILIAITAAENIPEDVLRELWDLVLQNRFARNGEQINILMFGEHYWAEDVKSWLPTNNNDKPVLLTTQTLEYDEETEIEGDLDELIANRRALFQERMKSRANSPVMRQSPLKIWWVKLALALVFLASFSSLLIWQYFDVTSAAVKEFTQFLFQSKSASEITRQPAELELEAEPERTESLDNQRVAMNFSDAMERIENSNQSQNSAIESTLESDINVATFSKQSADSPTSEFIADISAEQLKQLRDTGTISSTSTNNVTDTESAIEAPAELVTNGISTDISALAQDSTLNQNGAVAQDEALSASVMDALATLEVMTSRVTTTQVGTAEQPQAVASDPVVLNATNEQNTTQDSIDQASQSEQDLVTDIVEPQNVTPGTSGTGTPTNTPVTSDNRNAQQPLSLDTRRGEVNDYPVEDIVAQPEVTPDTVTQALETQLNLPSGNNSGSDTVTATTDSALPGEQTTSYQYHEPLLLELPQNSFVLQISGISSESLLQEYLVDNRLLNDVWVYKTRRYGGDWFVVVHNQNYTSLDAARAAAQNFSAQFPGTEPFAKNLTQVRNEIASVN